MAAALVLPRLLDRVSERPVMIAAAAVLTAGLAVMAAITTSNPLVQQYWPALLTGWAVLGIAYSMTVTPTGRLLRRSSHADDRPALFAAQFALSHVCWLLAYPVAGQAGALLGMSAASALLAAIAGIGLIAGLWKWPVIDPEAVEHVHADLTAGHPHLAGQGSGPHRHPYVIDDLHLEWPRRD